MIERREFLEGVAGLVLADQVVPAAHSMLSSGYIIRSGGRVRGMAEGRALGPDGRFRSFTRRRPFRVASVSKMVTAFGFMTLAMRGDVDLDADVSAYLGETFRHPSHPGQPLTPRLLLSHTSGLRNGDDFPVPFNQSLLGRLRHAASEASFGGWLAASEQSPGQWFAYSDTNFAVIAQIIERVTSRRFDLFMREALFAPLGLDIGYNWSGVSQRKRRLAAAGCRWDGSAWRAQVDAHPPPAPEPALYRAEGDVALTVADYRLGENGFAFAPHGGLRLSLGDMDVLAQLFAAAPEARTQAGAAWMFTPEAVNGETADGFYQAYGLGTQVPLGRSEDAFFGPDSGEWRGHCGDAYGWMTGLWWNTRARATLVYAINGMPEENRPQSARTALTEAEQALIDRALRDAGLI